MCVPIKTKTPRVTVQALREVFKEIGYSSVIMCDSGGEFQGEFAEECQEQDIDIITPVTGARFVERFIRTLKNHLIQRARSLGGHWSQYVEDVVDKYNDVKHSSTGEKPEHVADLEYDFDFIKRVHEQLMEHAKFPIKHPELTVGDIVKIRVKPNSFYKETFISWTKNVYTVRKIEETPNGTMYYLNGYRKPLLRFELKKIHDVQTYQEGNAKSVLQNVLQR